MRSTSSGDGPEVNKSKRSGALKPALLPNRRQRARSYGGRGYYHFVIAIINFQLVKPESAVQFFTDVGSQGKFRRTFPPSTLSLSYFAEQVVCPTIASWLTTV